MVSARQHESAAVWASALSARIRLIHAGFIDEPVEQRQAFLAEEIGRAVEGVAPAQKAEYLAALSAHFPEWRPAGAATVEPVPVALAPSELVGQLLDRVSELSSTERQTLVAAFKADFQTASADRQHAELWKKFGLELDRAPSPERTWRLLGTLLEFFLTLDQLAWTLWRSLGVKSAFWKESDLNKMAGPYLAGDSEVSGEHVRQTIERTRKLIAAILGASGRAAADVANEQAGRLSPEAIEVAARGEKRALESLDAACWREYKQRFASGNSASHVEAAILQAVARAAEDLIGGRTR